MTKEHTSEEIKYRLSDLGAQIGNIAINYITELEKENAELKEVHESDKRSLALIAKKSADFEKAYNEVEELLDKQIEATYKLFEENKELKEKAKEIIKNLLDDTYHFTQHYPIIGNHKKYIYDKLCKVIRKVKLTRCLEPSK